ncbi:hypothetical protein FACS1894187_21470 [Synergistales bacterium]|nr:hypothetical protein FACS1894187_21470 [Synergistales bacterium]
MPSILTQTSNRIFLIYGNLDDMFITPDLQKLSFRYLLNAHLKSLGFERIVYYSGAKNLGKFVLDDESARTAINKNKEPPSPHRSGRRILNPNAAASQAQTPSEPQPEPQLSAPLIYGQPKITPFEFLDDARAMMSSNEHRSAVVFAFMQDFLAERGVMQPYLELVSHLWDEYGADNRNICVFLAPRLLAPDIARMFDRMENGETLKNKFFNSGGAGGQDSEINASVCMEIGLPNHDELAFALESLRIIGDGEGGKLRKISFRHSAKKRIVSSLFFLSREADRAENGQGTLGAIYDTLTSSLSRSQSEVVNITEKYIQRLYARYKSADEPDPLQKLRDTRGWESVYKRIAEIVKDYELKKQEYEREYGTTEKNNGSFNDRIDPAEAGGFRYRAPHFILRGNPGVGKTTVARLIGRIFYDAGILKKGITIEAKRDDLVDAYVGGTAPKTTRCVEKAVDGVLFVDDAYSLLEKGTEHNYPQEAIDTLVPILTNPDRYPFCMIMAGYPEPMDKLLEMNVGLRSRFSAANILTIEDYPPDLLRDIFVSVCEKRGLEFTDDAPALDLTLFFTNLYNQRNRADFGNARDVVALAEEVTLKASLRIQENGNESEKRITKQDFGADAKFFEKRGASSIDEIYAELDSFVGLDFIKDIFKNIRLEILDARDSERRGVRVEPYPDHYIFAGNPGTGKTTVAKLLGRFYNMMGSLGGAETLFIDASDIIGSHYGDSKEKVTEKIQMAIDRNSVLYIDEAYQIIDSGYAQETIGAMMTRMTENARDFKMVFGMYSNRVDEFLSLNAGLSRRVRVVNFPDYNLEQLFEIFKRNIKSQGCTITEDASEQARSLLARLYERRDGSFGNAGEVQKFIIDMKRRRLERVETMDADNPLRYEYTIEDLPVSAA